MKTALRYAAAGALMVIAVMVSGFQAASKSTPSAQTGVPSPMLYDTTDPITGGYTRDGTRKGIPFYNMVSGGARPIWICNGTSWVQALPAITGATATLGGSLIALGSSVSGTAAVTGAATGSVCDATPADGSIPSASIVVRCGVVSGVATVQISAPLVAYTPPGVIYNVRVFQ